MGNFESQSEVYVTGNCLLADVPYFEWLNDMEDDIFVELFPGIYLRYHAPWEDDILRKTLDSEVSYHLIKAAELYSQMTCNGAVCELFAVHDEVERFLASLNLKFEYHTPIDLTNAVFVGASLLLLNDISPMMKKIISFDGCVYSTMEAGLEVKNESLIRFSRLEPREVTLIDKKGWQDYYQHWIWGLVFVLIKHRPKDRLYRFLLYIDSANYHKNAFSALMNYYSAIESIFGFGGNINKNIVEYAPILCEKTSGEMTELIQTCLNNASKLRNVHAHGNKVREKHYTLLHHTLAGMQAIAHRLLKGIIDIGFIPTQEELVEAKNQGLHMFDWSEIHKKEYIDSLSWSNVPNEIYDFDKVDERYHALWD